MFSVDLAAGAATYHYVGHGHSHASTTEVSAAERGAWRPRARRRLAITLAVTLAYMAAEVVGGLLTNSLALLADAGHMLSDAAALSLSLFALWMAQRPAGSSRTFGFYRTEILAALANGVGLLTIAVLIVIEAVQRLADPAPVLGLPMLLIACGGLAMNLVAIKLLHGERDTSLNIHGAFLHVLMDALGSVGAICAGLLIWAFGFMWADTVASLAVAVLVVFSAWSLLRESVNVLMESAPRHIDVDLLRDELLALPSVCAVNDLHIWTITSGMPAASVHVVTEATADRDAVLLAARDLLATRFEIEHSTIQVEAGDSGCPVCAAHW